MTRRTETIVIGAGQAGLTLSRELGRRGLPQTVLERKSTSTVRLSPWYQ